MPAAARKADITSTANPFVDDVFLSVKPGLRNKATHGRKNVKNERTGKKEDIAETHIYEKVDKTKFVMIYATGVSQITNISKPAIGVLAALMQSYLEESNVGDDVVSCTYVSAVRNHYYDQSRATWSKGISNLIDNDLIAKHQDNQSLYWINPACFFRGNRFRYIREFESE